MRAALRWDRGDISIQTACCHQGMKTLRSMFPVAVPDRYVIPQVGQNGIAGLPYLTTPRIAHLFNYERRELHGQMLFPDVVWR